MDNKDPRKLQQDSYTRLKRQLKPLVDSKIAVYPSDKNVFLSPPPEEEHSPTVRIMSYVFLLSQPKIVNQREQLQVAALERGSTIRMRDDVVQSELSKGLAKVYYKKARKTVTTDREQTLFSLMLLRYIRYWGSVLQLNIYIPLEGEYMYIWGGEEFEDDLDDGPEGMLAADASAYLK